MVKYHQSKLKEAKCILQNFFSDKDKVNLFRKSYSLHEDIKMNAQTYSICFMNSYSTMYYNRKGRYTFIFGDKVIEHIVELLCYIAYSRFYGGV